MERVLPITPGAGKRLSYLSNPGLHLLARHVNSSARELAQSWQADDAGLLGLLSRLPTLLVLQEVVNGLVDHAAEAITNQGRRPQLVRWTWQREVTHRFWYREQPLRLFVDGALALCIREPPTDGCSRHDRWYGLFLLSTDLDDLRLMRRRLERLLCWRESPERWPVYQHMPPVLILASSPRQREHWQHAAQSAALKMRLEPLQGAVVGLLVPLDAQVNPWRLNWLTLATEMPCRLSALLKPLPSTAFPPRSAWKRARTPRRVERPHLPRVAIWPVLRHPLAATSSNRGESDAARLPPLAERIGGTGGDCSAGAEADSPSVEHPTSATGPPAAVQ